MAAFGWSAGDLAAAIGVIWTVCESLKSAGGASDSYQESLGFLQGLHGTLKRLHDVNDRNLSSDDRNFIKSQLHLIQKPVDKFAQNIISRYGSDLGEKPTGKALRKWIIGSAKKVAWALLKEADKLRDEISLPLLSIQLCELYQIQLITCQLRDQLPTEISNHIITNIGNKFPNLLEQYIDPLRSHAVAQAQLQEDRDKRIKELLVEIPQDMKKLHRESDYRTQQVIGDAAELSKQTKAFLGEKIDQLPNQIVKDMNALTRATELQASMTLKTVQRMENALQENIFDVKALKSALIYKASPSEPEWEGQKLIKSGSKSGQTLMEVKMHFKELCLLLARLVRELLEQLWPLIAPIFLHLKTLQCYIAHVPSFLLNDNITFIDAFNRPRSLPYGTYRNWGTFTRFLQTSFEGIPGNRQIMDDNFWLTDNMGRTIDQSNWECSVRPKAQISMSIILDNWVIRDCCPKCRTKIGPASHMPNKLLKCTGQGCGLEIYLASASTTFMTQMTKRAAQRPEFPVSYEISRSVQYFKGLHSREQARENYKHLVEPGETLIQEQHIDNYKNIHNEYAHLVLAEQRKGFSPPGEFVWDVVKQEEDRKAEAFELQKYFRRVLFVGSQDVMQNSRTKHSGNATSQVSI
ncbi:hypothetical protein DID88_006956 [Monilinia fructigena]|uniref:Ubiquitin-like domain-containing protein n=1 Tax=Monilinia fructigena TaxID=38457 RepID=A0A395IGE8_9HELO|nr:hypothetical protein DID88_006956 [Monilinia fructigena]